MSLQSEAAYRESLFDLSTAKSNFSSAADGSGHLLAASQPGADGDTEVKFRRNVKADEQIQIIQIQKVN